MTASVRPKMKTQKYKTGGVCTPKNIGMTAILSPNERQKKLISSVNLHTVRVNLVKHSRA